MRIVRFVDAVPSLPEAWLSPQWGVLAEELVFPLQYAPYLLHSPTQRSLTQFTGPPRKLDLVSLLAPVSPGKLVCVGRNYAEHAAELGNDVPPEPLIFLKPPSCVVGPNAPVVYPAISERVDHEGELAVVIGQRCRHLREREVDKMIFGYTIANDVTARDLQRKDGQWTRGKGFDTFAPIGPWIDTSFDPANRVVRCLVNGEVRQHGNTELMIYPIRRILVHITQFMTLEPGDVVLTGTPSGVGPVQPGDIMTVEVESLGTLSNSVVAESAAEYDVDE